MNETGWRATNRETGEDISIEEFDQRRKKTTGSFQLAYKKFLLRYLETVDSPSVILLCHFIKYKDGKNRVLHTQKEISEISGVSLVTVKKVVKRLIANECLIKLKNGQYMLNPLILSYGGVAGNINKSVWGEVKDV